MYSSRYWDEPALPLYAFGHGLSYTTFEYSNLRVAAGEVSVELRNSGRRAGDEVVQVYIHQRAGGASRPIRQLKGFSRVALTPGEKRTLKFPLGQEQLSYWSPVEKNWVFEKEEFDVWAGGDSKASLHVTYRP